MVKLYQCVVLFNEDIENHKDEYETDFQSFVETYGEERLISSGNESDLPFGINDDDVFFYLDGRNIESLRRENNGEDFVVVEFEKL